MEVPRKVSRERMGPESGRRSRVSICRGMTSEKKGKGGLIEERKFVLS